ncbi:MAG: efflux RND transporter periplasmic adaptor subunit [Burkholderiales bacterium]|nr:efflux RND transporter periplasmic adaptor subunit [Burkholderiales bacterium]
MKKSYLMASVVALAVAAGVYGWWSQKSAADAVDYRSVKIERGTLQATVAASGAVNPVALVTVGTQVSGQIKELLVDFNSEVKAGQLLARIDPETFEYRVRSAQADVDAARATVLTAQANALAAQAQVSRAQVDLDEARRDFERKQSLVEKAFIAQSEADKARALVNTSTEALKAVQAQVGVAQAQVKSAQATVAQREASLAQARIDLERTRITSPVNGIVIKRAIENGQTVAASLQAPELFIIAKNLRDMQVDASIDESDVGRLTVGQKASFTVDAFPGQTFEGEIRQVRKAATNVANVVTYVAVVGFSNEAGKLLPGMTANVRVVTDVRENVLKVPNAALRVRIAGVEPPAAPAASAPTVPATPASAPTGSGPTEFRNRVVKELQLGEQQTAQVDAIYAESRPKFMALRDLAPEDRAKARDRLTSDIRARIADTLTPDQKPKFAALVAEAASRTSTRGRIYLMADDGKPKAFNVRLGITDGTNTELLVSAASPDAGALKEGANVIVGVQSQAMTKSGAPKSAAPTPRLGF